MKHRIGIFSAFFLAIALLPALIAAPTAHAANYDASNLIRDDLFIDSNAMTEADIQAFLAAHGSCLATADPSLLDSSQRASALIYNAAQQFGISPKVIMTTMQKEWSLLTTSCSQLDSLYGAYSGGPNVYLKRALGYNVPDVLGVGTCLYSFSRQLFGATCDDGNVWMGSPKWFRSHWNTGDGPNGTTYPQSFTVQQYSDRTGDVTITPRTKATSVLYRYTPYAYYGNFNFWNVYNTFFPPDPYSSEWTSQSNVPPLIPGQTVALSFRFENRGYMSWSGGGANAVKLATAAPTNRASMFADQSWLNVSNDRNRAARLTSVEAGDSLESVDQGTVKPGQVAVFTFSITVPNGTKPGSYREFFTPSLEGLPGKIELGGVYMDIPVIKPYEAAWVDQSAFPTLISGDTTTGWIEVRNVGGLTWYKGSNQPIRLATTNPVNRASKFATSDWQVVSADNNRPSAPSTLGTFDLVLPGWNGDVSQEQVKPGQIARFPYTLKANSNVSPGTYMEPFTLVQEGGIGDMGAVGIYTKITVIPAPKAYDASWQSQSAFPTVNSGETSSFTLKFRNTGANTWYNSGASPIRLATARPMNHWSMFNTSDWAQYSADDNRPTTFSATEAGSDPSVMPGQVKPGQIGVFTFGLKGHDWIAKKSYTEYYTLVQDNGAGQFGPDDVYVRFTIR